MVATTANARAGNERELMKRFNNAINFRFDERGAMT